MYLNNMSATLNTITKAEGTLRLDTGISYLSTELPYRAHSCAAQLFVVHRYRLAPFFLGEHNQAASPESL